jgi:hypothetical protein
MSENDEKLNVYLIESVEPEDFFDRPRWALQNRTPMGTSKPHTRVVLCERKLAIWRGRPSVLWP